ncbi:MAG: MarR family transcriptional regulator [Firmicutes bacterium]|nr:MarR family transcriptional regulator [Bacillota bacterium]
MNPAIQSISQEMSVLARLLTAKMSDPVIASMDRSAYLLLSELERAGALSIGVLADLLFLDISTASRQVAQLEGKELVARFPDPKDGRGSLVEVTDKGRARYMEVRAARWRAYERILCSWDHQEIDQLEQLLERFTKDMRSFKKRAYDNEPGSRV